MSETEVPLTFGGLTRGKELGRGASGTVFSCERDGDKFAAKAIDLRRLRLSAKADRELKKLQREVDILRRVPPHPNLVQFVDALEEGSWFFLVLEYVSGGDLFSALVRRPTLPNRRPAFKEAETVYVLAQLIEGLDFLHSHGVIHRDLKLENILVTKQTRQPPNVLCDVKITDFGLSKVVGDGMSAAHSTVGSPRYIAPEVLARGIHDFRADLWSLGVLLHVLLAGRFPLDGPADISQGSTDLALGRLEASTGARSVVLGLLQVERDKRMTLAAVRQHEWLKLMSASIDSAPAAKRPRPAAAPAASTISLFGSEDFDDDDVEQVTPIGTPVTPVPDSDEEDDQVVFVDAAKSMPPPTATAPAAAAARRPAPPAPAQPPLESREEAQVASIAELDGGGGSASSGSFKSVRGKVVFRTDFKTGGGFQLRLRDATGDIDLRFWDGAAERFREHPDLQKGTDLRFEGFQTVALKPKDLAFAPQGRLHSLAYNAPDSVTFFVEAPCQAPHVVPAKFPVAERRPTAASLAPPVTSPLAPVRPARPPGAKVVPARRLVIISASAAKPAPPSREAGPT